MKKPITIRIDEDVLDWFKSQGKGYQSLMNHALSDRMEAEIQEIQNEVEFAKELHDKMPPLDAKSKRMGKIVDEMAITGNYPEFFKPMPKKK